MIHAREDYNRIQDPELKIPENEPVFLIRGQDKIAPQVVSIWADLAEIAGAEQNIINAARNHVLKMKEWQNKINVKIPDMEEKFI